jgi:hypothetical protein
MPYVIEASLTRERIDLESEEWWNLLALAYRYGWEPDEGLEYYLYHATEVPASVAKAIADALVEAAPHLPAQSTERPTTPEQVLAGPSANPSGYFGGEYRGLVGEFAKLCQKGSLEVRRTPPIE